MVDAGDSKSPAARRAGSIPAPGTRLEKPPLHCSGGFLFGFSAYSRKSSATRLPLTPKTTRRDMQSGMMVTAGQTNHMIAGHTMWNPAYRQARLAKHGQELRTGNGRLHRREVMCMLASASASHQRGLFIHSRTIFALRLGKPVGGIPRPFLPDWPRGQTQRLCLAPPGQQAAWLPETSRLKASPGILTCSLRCASDRGFRSPPLAPSSSQTTSVAVLSGG